jgi:hypothetical protein
MKLKIFAITAIIFFTCACISNAQDMPPATSMVYPGMDGKLVYVADSAGNKIPDFSYAGYKGGGVVIPYVPVKLIVWPVAGDNSDNIQAAIDKLSAMPVDATGFRGTVLLKMGLYALEKPITIKASGIVLRGEGMSDIGTVLIGKTVRDAQGRNTRGRAALISIAGSSGWTPQEETKQPITDSYVPVGAKTFMVPSAKGFKAGDKILVRRNGNEDWIKALGQDTLSVGRFRWRPFTISYDRVITEVKGNTITIDAPVFTAIETRWGGGEVVKYVDTGRIEQVGIENLRGVSEYDPAVRMKAYGNMDRGGVEGPGQKYETDEYYADENHYFNFINFSNAKNGWVRNIAALHFGSSVVQTTAGTKWITIQDCESWEPVSVRAGARRFTYQLNGQLTLAQRCFSQKGRHSFVMQTPSSSGNVFFNCEAIHPYSSSEPHANWVNGALFDNVKAPLTARFWKDITIGWAGANIVFWNCEGDFLVQQPPTAQNYSFGHVGTASVIFNRQLQELSKPNGFVESVDRHVAPKSLYLSQLKDRLGEMAVKNISKPIAD